MQFCNYLNELYKDVIKKVGENRGFEVTRADEIYNSGLIIEDINRKILESKLIIAEVTPKNPNVYYELGFAHAINKPTILLAEKDTKLPFDINPFRTLFYKNTIGGKQKIEELLEKHIQETLKINF